MNDMPTTPGSPSPDGKAIADLAEQLNQLLRLRTFPIGMKLFEDVAEMEATGLRLPTTSNMTIEDVDGETLLMNLDVRGFAVSTGAAWSAPVAMTLGERSCSENH